MRKHLLFAITTAIMSLSFASLKAEDAFVLPAGEPQLTITFPIPREPKDVTIAVSKALIAETWDNLAWSGTITSATVTHHHVNIKVFVVTSPTHVKLYSTWTEEGNVSEEKGHKTAEHYLEKLEKKITKELNLDLHKGRGSDGSDIAT